MNKLCPWNLWAGQYKDTGEITPVIWLNKKVARFNLGPHMRVIQVEIRLVAKKRKKK